MRKEIVLLAIMACCIFCRQETNAQGFIETNSVFLFDSTNGNQANGNGATYSFNFNRNFTNTPRVGLAVFSMDFQYSPVFSCQVTSNTTTTSAILLITTQSTSHNNQLYIMYLATDHDFLGVFMPGALITYMLNQGTPGLMTQSFPFNFKQQITTSSQVSNIRVSVYLTGITSSSELVSNGYPTNHTYFFIQQKILSSTNYQIDVSVNSLYGDVTISQVQYTIIYFDVTLMQSFRYLMDKGDVTLQNFGGTSDSSQKSITLSPLAYNANFEALKIFYGISGLECKQGASITLSAIHQSYLNPLTNATQVLLTMQTWKLAMMLTAQYNFIQYQSLKCGLPGANCDGTCLTSSQPHFTLQGVCNFCQSSCLACNVTNTSSRCDTCDSTRYLNNASGLCICNAGFYDSLQSNVCNSCFPCATCNLKGVCLACSTDLHMVLNTILASCECAPGYYPNYNITANTTLNISTPCFKCPDNCLYCLNGTFCLACNTLTYLNSKGVCFFICTDNQKYNDTGNACIFTSSSMYDQKGRLGYEWSYTSNQSQLSILLTFSQSDPLFYYYENGQGYAMINSTNINLSQAETANFYYDDGANSAGYSISASQAEILSIGSMGSSPANIFGNSQLSNMAAANQSAAEVNNLFQQGSIDDSSLNGSYYGLGEQQFIRYLYQDYLIQYGFIYNYYDKYNIPYGKYKLSSNPPIKNPNFADALASNVEFKIKNQTIPFTMVALSNNQFQLTASVSKSYYGDNGYLVLKNPGLVRYGSTASQLTNVSQVIYIYDCAIPSYVSAANNIYDSNSIIVEVLWGLGKYPLFLGFGWIFMPLMLVLQYIMSLNYIDTTKPLNLDRFLASFADFRSPSIFYNPMRNSIDKAIINHPPMYLNIQPYNRFDKGIDFMENCFQFFFVPFLSTLLYALIVGINTILNTFEKDIPLISNYIKPRFSLHIAAYTLVQALPVSFFFFAQLNDSRYSSANEPNSIYPIFNVSMSYLAFFLTCSIPVMVMTHIYFIYTTKQNKVKSAKDFKALFKNLLQSTPNGHHKACLNDPLWTCDQLKIVSYGFGLAIFYLAVLYGFFTSFYIEDYAWQITGLILVTAGLLAFTAANTQFTSWVIKVFWIIFCVLMLAFLFLLAGIGSNTSAAPCDQQNLGYLGIGFLYALLLVALIASCILLWFAIFQIYNNYFKEKHFVVNLKDQKEEVDDKPERIKGFQSTTKLKSTYMKNPIQSQIAMGSRMNIGSMNMGGSMHGNDRNRLNQHEPATEDRMIIAEVNPGEEDEVSHNMRQKLLFYQMKPRTGDYIFISEGDKKEYGFGEVIGQRLKEKQLIYIDNNQDIFDRDNQYLGSYENLNEGAKQQKQNVAIKQQDQLFTANEREMVKKDTLTERQPIIQHTSSHELDSYEANRKIPKRSEPQITNIYIINGEEYSKQGEDANGLLIMRNVQTNQIRKISPSSFQNAQIEQQEILNDSLQKELPKSNSNEGLSSSQKRKQIFISPQIQNNKVIIQSKRKFKYADQQYIDLGQEGNLFKLYNTSKKTIEKVQREKYIRMNIESFETRINLNGLDYEFDYFGPNKSVHFAQIYTKRPKVVSQDEFMRLKSQNQAAFRSFIGEAPNIQSKKNVSVSSQRVQILKGDDPNQINNMLLIQSKAVRTDNSNFNNNAIQNNLNIIKQTSTTTVKEVELSEYTSKGRQEVLAEEIDQQQSDDDETIEKVLQKSPGPFQLLVVPNDKVQQVDGADNYLKEDAIQKIILQGLNVMHFMQKTQKKHPRAALFMVDLSNQEQYRLI